MIKERYTREEIKELISSEKKEWAMMAKINPGENEEEVYHAISALEHLEERLFSKDECDE